MGSYYMIQRNEEAGFFRHRRYAAGNGSKGSGTGIAMGNADDALKQIADFVTSSLEDNGIAEAFQKYRLV
jgi:hypothetical protein